MIKKFISIKNVGRFENYTVRGNVEFQALTLVFALSETIRLMAEIDEVVEKNGGWPLK